MDTCKAKIYHTRKSGLPTTQCTNKAKDHNGFCFIHKKQSQEYEYRLQHGFIDIKIQYQNDEPCTVKMRAQQKMSLIIKPINEKYNIKNHLLTYNGDFIDLTLPAVIFDDLILQLELPGG
jgi:hypothetical protein